MAGGFVQGFCQETMPLKDILKWYTTRRRRTWVTMPRIITSTHQKCVFLAQFREVPGKLGVELDPELEFLSQDWESNVQNRGSWVRFFSRRCTPQALAQSPRETYGPPGNGIPLPGPVCECESHVSPMNLHDCGITNPWTIAQSVPTDNPIQLSGSVNLMDVHDSVNPMMQISEWINIPFIYRWHKGVTPAWPIVHHPHHFRFTWR